MQSHTFERADLVETHIKPGLAESMSASKERKLIWSCVSLTERFTSQRIHNIEMTLRRYKISLRNKQLDYVNCERRSLIRL
jgi:hypothetical protein